MSAKENPAGFKYTATHEWLQYADGQATCGLTDYAQSTLTDIVFVELPPAGKKVKAGERAAVVESVKSVSDIHAPVSGDISAVNEALRDAPELVNSDAYGSGWIFKIAVSDEQELAALLSKDGYEQLLRGGAS